MKTLLAIFLITIAATLATAALVKPVAIALAPLAIGAVILWRIHRTQTQPAVGISLGLTDNSALRELQGRSDQ